MRARPVVLLALLALATSGCAERTIDVTKSATLIQDAVEQQVGATVAAMSCPEKVRVAANATFQCLVTASDGTQGRASVTQTDDKGTISVAAPFLNTIEAETSIQTDLRRRSPRATVQCPEIIVVRKGATFECEADLGPVRSTVIATQTGANGSFTYEVKPR